MCICIFAKTILIWHVGLLNEFQSQRLRHEAQDIGVLLDLKNHILKVNLLHV